MSEDSAAAGRMASMDSFAMRQFAEDSKNRLEYDPLEFRDKVNEHYAKVMKEREADPTIPDPLREGYAPFCKHIFLPNFIGDSCRVDCVPITDDNRQFLETKYVSRTEQELPVLVRYFRSDKVKAPPAKFFDVILYSREQIHKENEAMGNKPNEDETEPWGIICIKPSLVDYETPMQPITSLRNALGKEHGGSGVDIDRDAYNKSVEYWSKHANIGDGE